MDLAMQILQWGAFIVAYLAFMLLGIHYFRRGWYGWRYGKLQPSLGEQISDIYAALVLSEKAVKHRANWQRAPDVIRRTGIFRMVLGCVVILTINGLYIVGLASTIKH